MREIYTLAAIRDVQARQPFSIDWSFDTTNHFHHPKFKESIPVNVVRV